VLRDQICPPMRLRDKVVRESSLADWLGIGLAERVKQAARRLVCASRLASKGVLVILPRALAVVLAADLASSFAIQ
jgi:hypothetical protein